MDGPREIEHIHLYYTGLGSEGLIAVRTKYRLEPLPDGQCICRKISIKDEPVDITEAMRRQFLACQEAMHRPTLVPA